MAIPARVAFFCPVNYLDFPGSHTVLERCLHRSGVLFREGRNGGVADDRLDPGETTWEVAAQFRDFTVWGHDIGPDPLSDQYINALDWVEVSEVVRVRDNRFCLRDGKVEPWKAF